MPNEFLTVSLGDFRDFCKVQESCEHCTFHCGCIEMLINDPQVFSETLINAQEDSEEE